MARDSEGILDGLREEFEQANAVTSANVGITLSQSETATVQEELAGDLANVEGFVENQEEAGL